MTRFRVAVADLAGFEDVGLRSEVSIDGSDAKSSFRRDVDDASPVETIAAKHTMAGLDDSPLVRLLK